MAGVERGQPAGAERLGERAVVVVLGGDDVGVVRELVLRPDDQHLRRGQLPLIPPADQAEAVEAVVFLVVPLTLMYAIAWTTLWPNGKMKMGKTKTTTRTSTREMTKARRTGSTTRPGESRLGIWET